jgi:hypothetical protein
MRTVLAYSSARILLFVAALGAGYLVGAHGLLLLLLAAVVSGLVSFVVLSGQRDVMSRALASRLGEFRRRLDDGTRAEDRE